MSLAELNRESAGGEKDPKLKKWTGEEYDRLVELGAFTDQRVELVNGEVLETSPMSDPHAQAIQLVVYALLPHFPPSNAVLRVQMPMRLGNSRPEPDIAVVAGTPRQVTKHPGSALLVIEVSDRTLAYDRTTKAALYAEHGIAEYWIINLPGQCVEVHRGPIVQPGDPRYGEIRAIPPGEQIAPISAPDAKIAIADLLP